MKIVNENYYSSSKNFQAKPKNKKNKRKCAYFLLHYFYYNIKFLFCQIAAFSKFIQNFPAEVSAFRFRTFPAEILVANFTLAHMCFVLSRTHCPSGFEQLSKPFFRTQFNYTICFQACQYFFQCCYQIVIFTTTKASSRILVLLLDLNRREGKQISAAFC